MTLDDILGSPTILQLRNELLSRLKVAGFPITDEFSGAVMRTLWELMAITLLDLVGENGDAQKTALGIFPSSTTGDWLTLLADKWFDVQRIPGTFCEQTVTLASPATAPQAYTFTAGRGTVVNAAGQRFQITSGGTLSPGGTLAVLVKAEQAAAGQGLVNAIVSPQLPGVTVQGAVIYNPGPGLLYGSDTESDAALMVRVLGRWPDFDAIPEDDRMVAWAKAGSTEVARVRLDVDAANLGGVIITIAGASGPVSGGAVTAVQAYINDRAPITDLPTVQNASILSIEATGGTVTVEAARMLEAQAAAEAAWLAVLNQTQIGDAVYLEKLVQILMDQPGVIDVQDLELNGAPDDVPLSINQVPVKAGDLVTLVTWVPV